MVATSTAYIVAWTHQRQRWLIDVDTPGLAAVVGILLAESGRDRITINDEDYEPDPEVSARIKERIRHRLEVEAGIKAAMEAMAG